MSGIDNNAPRARPSTSAWGDTYADAAAGTSINHYDAVQRRLEAQKVTAKTPTEQLIDRNIAKYYREKDEERAREAAKAAARQARANQIAQEEARQKKIQDFRMRDHLITGMLNDSGLTQVEKQAVMDKLGKMAGGTQSIEMCHIAIEQVILERKKGM